MFLTGHLVVGTVRQLRLFAEVVRQADWLGLRIDPALPERKPLPRNPLSLRRMVDGKY